MHSWLVGRRLGYCDLCRLRSARLLPPCAPDPVGQPDCHSTVGKEAARPAQETSEKRLVVGPLDIHLHSSAVHRVLKMVACALDHEYEPYCRPQSGQTQQTPSPLHRSLSCVNEFRYNPRLLRVVGADCHMLSLCKID